MCFHPDPEKWVMCAYTKIGFFADNDADIIYQDEVHGSRVMQVEKTMDLIYTKYMKALISYDGIHRKETFFFPKEAPCHGSELCLHDRQRQRSAFSPEAGV